MYVSCRQLQDQLRATGKIILPPNARLTPLANDFLRQQKLSIEVVAAAVSPAATEPKPTENAAIQYWFGVHSGVAKAAMSAVAREYSLAPNPTPNEASQLIPAIKSMASLLKQGKVTGCILVVEHAGPAVVLANRKAAVRAVVATSQSAITHAINTIAANMLIVEPGSLSMAVMRNLLSAFARGVRPATESVDKLLAEVAT
jgi:hypothetical protein